MSTQLTLGLIGLGIVMMLVCYRLTKATAWDNIFVNIFFIKPLRSYNAIIVFAGLVLVLLIMMNISMEQSKKQRKETAFSREMQLTQRLGESLGKKLSVIAPAASNALVINRINDRSQQQVHNEFILGLRAGIFRNIEKIDSNLMYPPEPTTLNYPIAISEYLNIKAKDLDQIMDKYPHANVVISLVGIPKNYVGSKTWYRVTGQELIFIAVSNDVYLFGEQILNNEITACVVPRMLYSYDKMVLNALSKDGKGDNEDLVFTQLYYYINASNIVKILMQNNRLFKFERKIVL
jgi:hypothetical protein